MIEIKTPKGEELRYKYFKDTTPIKSLILEIERVKITERIEILKKIDERRFKEK